MPSGAVLGDNTFTKSKSGNNKADTEKVRSIIDIETIIDLTQKIDISRGC